MELTAHVLLASNRESFWHFIWIDYYSAIMLVQVVIFHWRRQMSMMSSVFFHLTTYYHSVALMKTNKRTKYDCWFSVSFLLSQIKDLFNVLRNIEQWTHYLCIGLIQKASNNQFILKENINSVHLWLDFQFSSDTDNCSLH